MKQLTGDVDWIVLSSASRSMIKAAIIGAVAWKGLGLRLEVAAGRGHGEGVMAALCWSSVDGGLRLAIVSMALDA